MEAISQLFSKLPYGTVQQWEKYIVYIFASIFKASRARKGQIKMRNHACKSYIFGESYNGCCFLQERKDFY